MPAAELIRMIDPPWPPSMIFCAPGHHGVPGTCHVDIHDIAKGLRGDLVPGLRSRDPGIRDDDVEPAEFRKAVVDGLAQAVDIPRVDDRGPDALAGFLHQTFRLGEVLRGC